MFVHGPDNGVPLLDLKAFGLLGRRIDVARGLTGGVFTHKIIVIFVSSNYTIVHFKTVR